MIKTTWLQDEISASDNKDDHGDEENRLLW